ncbi:hypothetical protein SAMN04488025_104127 [Planifilum fulgidum]|jgi:hypothetical protein|uniref:YIEGIA protein n=1 Tax=Planifilum fulgidum TaxID=201973 RepID=A0A1I2L7H8_9BACL|nr:YIEGIA family protein [Planifilum fulgidum]SFF75155.1 hypothetical protein SAMN04488025_104127 [Planifilum fulgidum]
MKLELYTQAVIAGLVVGFLARLRMLRTDYRQYPTYPHGQVIHLSLGLIAAALGSVAVPALLDRNYTAVTFLTLAAQQFREVRNMERETLSKLDQMELVPRGSSYIEGIAMVFEGRNYLVIFAAFVTSLAVILGGWISGALAGAVMIWISGRLRSGKYLGEIADVSEGVLRLEGPNLYVDDIYLMNVGLIDDQERIRQNGLGIIIKPRDEDSRVTLSNVGQRQAILHDVSAIMGVYRDTGEPALVPISKRDVKDGRLGLLLLPQKRDARMAIEVIKRVPVLESAVRMPTEIGEN